MKIRIDYSHYFIVDVPDNIIKSYELEAIKDELLGIVLESYLPEGAKIDAWEYPVEEHALNEERAKNETTS